MVPARCHTGSNALDEMGVVHSQKSTGGQKREELSLFTAGISNQEEKQGKKNRDRIRNSRIQHFEH